MVEMTDQDILSRYQQGYEIEKIVKSLSRNERIKVSEARERVETVLLEAKRKEAMENKDEREDNS